MATGTIKGSPLETITVASGVYAYRKGNVVTVIWNNATTTSTSARTDFGTLPVGWRPPFDVFAPQINGNVGYGDVGANGVVQGFRPTIGAVTTSISYVTA